MATYSGKVGNPTTVSMIMALPDAESVKNCQSRPLTLGYKVCVLDTSNTERTVGEKFSQVFNGARVRDSFSISPDWRSITIETYVQREGQEEPSETGAVSFFPEFPDQRNFTLDFSHISDPYFHAEAEASDPVREEI